MKIKNIAAGSIVAAGLGISSVVGASPASATPTTTTNNYTIVINLFSNNTVTKTRIFNWGANSFNSTTYNTTNNTTYNTTKGHGRK